MMNKWLVGLMIFEGLLFIILLIALAWQGNELIVLRRCQAKLEDVNSCQEKAEATRSYELAVYCGELLGQARECAEAEGVQVE